MELGFEVTEIVTDVLVSKKKFGMLLEFGDDGLIMAWLIRVQQLHQIGGIIDLVSVLLSGSASIFGKYWFWFCIWLRMILHLSDLTCGSAWFRLILYASVCICLTESSCLNLHMVLHLVSHVVLHLVSPGFVYIYLNLSV